MIDLLNDLTLTFVHLIHNFELKFVDLQFRVMPTMGTTVNTSLSDWKEFGASFREESAGYIALIGKSKDDIWTLILGEWVKKKAFNTEMTTWQPLHDQWKIDHDQWIIDVQTTPALPEPDEPVIPVDASARELSGMFDYIQSVGVK